MERREVRYKFTFYMDSYIVHDVQEGADPVDALRKSLDFCEKNKAFLPGAQWLKIKMNYIEED